LLFFIMIIISLYPILSQKKVIESSKQKKRVQIKIFTNFESD
jgi:hypothetical protein